MSVLEEEEEAAELESADERALPPPLLTEAALLSKTDIEKADEEEGADDTESEDLLSVGTRAATELADDRGAEKEDVEDKDPAAGAEERGSGSTAASTDTAGTVATGRREMAG